MWCIIGGKLVENVGNVGNEGVFDVFRRIVYIELYLCFFIVELKFERSVGIFELIGNFILLSISLDYCLKVDIIIFRSIWCLKFFV